MSARATTPWLEDRKLAFIRLEGTTFGGVPLNVELKLKFRLTGIPPVLSSMRRAAPRLRPSAVLWRADGALQLFHEVTAGPPAMTKHAWSRALFHRWWMRTARESTTPIWFGTA